MCSTATNTLNRTPSPQTSTVQVQICAETEFSRSSRTQLDKNGKLSRGRIAVWLSKSTDGKFILAIISPALNSSVTKDKNFIKDLVKGFEVWDTLAAEGNLHTGTGTVHVLVMGAPFCGPCWYILSGVDDKLFDQRAFYPVFCCSETTKTRPLVG